MLLFCLPQAAKSAASSPLPAPAAAAAAALASPATPAVARSPIGFGADEEFISLKFDDDDAAASPNTPGAAGRGTKRKSFGGDEEDGGTPAKPTRPDAAYRAPWAPGPYTHPSFTLRMHEEILDFCAFVAPKPAEQVMREELIQRIETLAREAFPKATNLRLKPFGSYATKLYLPISDIDLVLFGADPTYATNPSIDLKGKNSALGLLERHMRQKGNASYLEHISGARIPILKLTDKLTGVKVDICYEIEGGLKAAEFIVGMQQSMPSLRPLTLFLKYYLHCRVLNDTYKGGIGSFMLQLMLINHLQMLDFEGRLNHPMTNLGSLLMSFLEFYGCSFNYKNVGLYLNHEGSTSCNGPRRPAFFRKETKGWFNPNRPYLLSIENPLDASHDVGSNSYLIMRVRKALQFGYQTIAAHVHYEQQDGTPRIKKRQRYDLTADPAYPFAAPSSTPPTLLSQIVSVNEDLRPGQEEVEFEEMEKEIERDQQDMANRKRNVHVIESSDEETTKEEFKQPAFGEVDLSDDDDDDADDADASDDDDASDDGADAAIDDALEDGEIDANGEMSKFEKRFADIDDGDNGDDDDDDAPIEINSDEDDEDQQIPEYDDDDDDDGDDSDAMAIDVDDADYDDGELFTTPSGSKRLVHSSTPAHSHAHSHHKRNNPHKPTPTPTTPKRSYNNNNMDGDFIPLSGGSGRNFSHSSSKGGGGGHGGPSNKKKKSGSFDFSHTPHPSNSYAKKAKSKKKPLLQGHRTDGTRPNNQIYESNRSKAKKQRARQNKSR